MRDATAGDPMSGLKWTHKPLRAVARELEREGYPISAPTLARLLYARDYALRVNRKKGAGATWSGGEGRVLTPTRSLPLAATVHSVRRCAETRRSNADILFQGARLASRSV